jgi:hypothetical protein
MWLATYKPFGWEVVEKRYGGLRIRLESLSDRLKDYIEGRVPSIPEFEAKLEKIHAGPGPVLPDLRWARASTPSAIK